MFTEILKIIPKIDDAALKKIEAALNSRFARVAKKFGGGIVNVLKGGGIAGIALSFIDKVLNPLKETQEAIERTLKASDDIVTNAKQFNGTSGELFKLVQLGKSTGLDADNLFMLITKFQTAVAEAKADPNKATSVRNFVGQENTIQAFYQFIQELQKMNKSQQLLVQSEVFGEKQILKMADFLQTDFKAQTKLIGAKDAATYTPSLEKLGGLNDLTDALTARRELQDTLRKGSIINEGMVRARDRSEQIALQQENARIASYQNLATISDTTTKIMGLVENGVSLLGGFITKITPVIQRLTDTLSKLAGSRWVRGLFGGDDK